MSAIFTLKEKVMETGKEHPFQPEGLHYSVHVASIVNTNHVTYN